MKFLRALLVLVLLCAAAWFVLRAPFGPSGETFVSIPSGTSTAGIAQRLHAAGIIRSAFAFELLRKYRGTSLKAGEYRFDHPAPLPEIYARIARGDVYTRPVVIPEGFNLFDIAQAVQNAGLAPAPVFLAAARANTQLIADLDPHATSLEGFLFPDTYRFSPHATPAQMLTAMVRRFRQEIYRAYFDGQPAPHMDEETRAYAIYQAGVRGDIERIVTLASLIEKEVHIDAERPLVAGVFTNRLALNMPLATDPAVIYAALLANRWRGTIYQSDLQFDSPYNTYRHPGLPPGPICNPGLAALRAALHPTQTDFLYFVADANGTTRFSATLAEHNAQVAAYRQSLHP